jgi:predicted amidohydrolase YtcJ
LTYVLRNCRILWKPNGTKIVDIGISKGKIISIRKSRAVPKKGTGAGYDAEGKIVLPSFIDCHCHLFSLAEQDEEIDLRGSKSIEEMQDRIRKYMLVKAPVATQDWVFGRGWDQDLFKEKRFPSKEDLDSVVDSIPLVLTRICGHIAVMNSRALEFFKSKGAFSGTSNELVPLDIGDNFIGIVKENALTNCWRALPKVKIEHLERLFLKAQTQALHFGLSGVHCILNDLDQLDAIRRLALAGKLRLRLTLFLPIDSIGKVERMRSRQRSRFLRGKSFQVAGFKLFADGSLGARTAALNEDYSDDPGNKGILNYAEEQIIDYAKRAKKLDLILATHAIGDKAVEQVARAYKKAGISPKDHFRIEHCSVVRLQKIRDLSGIILSVQPMFAVSDFWLKNRIGGLSSKRVGYCLRTLSKRNLLIGGSDAPVESLNPLTGIRAALHNIADPRESLSLLKAIEMYTKGAAIASKLTRKSGSIGIGRSCDVVVLNVKDPSTIPESQVVDLFIDGKRIDR